MTPKDRAKDAYRAVEDRFPTQKGLYIHVRHQTVILKALEYFINSVDNGKSL